MFWKVLEFRLIETALLQDTEIWFNNRRNAVRRLNEKNQILKSFRKELFTRELLAYQKPKDNDIAVNPLSSKDSYRGPLRYRGRRTYE